MKHLDECQGHEHSYKFHIELVSKYSHGQASLHDCLTDPFVHSFYFGLSQRTKEHLHDIRGDLASCRREFMCAVTAYLCCEVVQRQR